MRFVLREHLRGLREKLDPATWVNSRWAEVEAFVEALCNYSMHPAHSETVPVYEPPCTAAD